MRGAQTDTPHFGVARNLEIADRASAYPWIVTPPVKGRYLELAAQTLFELPTPERKHQSNYGKSRSGNPGGRPCSLSHDEVRALRVERERTKLTYAVLGAKYGVSDEIARNACIGTGKYGEIK